MLKTIKKHLVHASRVVRHALRDHATGGKRSSKWPKVEKQYLHDHPFCAACLMKTNLNVHHKQPFHLNPALELDESNLITLCMAPGFDCHILLGHGDYFKAYNPNVAADAATSRELRMKFDLAGVQKLEVAVKAARKYEL